jgi:kinetochore protein Spc7/SPC105
MGGSQQMSSSPFSGSSADGSEDRGLQGEAGDDDDDDNSSTSGFDGESTAMSLDDITAQSAATARSDGSNTSSSARLNEALRQAAREAGTRSIDDDENGDMSMEIADQEITGAFQPWIKKGERQSFDWEDLSARHDQENAYSTNQQIDDAGVSETASDNGDEDMSMEVTNAIGRIISKPASRRQSTIRRKSSGEETNYGEQTMELTNVIGGIAQPVSPARSTGADSNANEDEEMTMEFTSVVGGLLGKSSIQDADEGDYGHAGSSAQEPQDQNLAEWNEDDATEDGEDMEITGAVGGILPPNEEQDELQDDDQTPGMEVTTAMGRILPSEVETRDREEANRVMEVEADSGEFGSSPFQDTVRQSPAKSPVPFHVAAIASESGSPSLASVRSRVTRQRLSHGSSSTPISTTPKVSPSKSSTPKQMTPEVNRPTTPGKTPPSSANEFRSASPKKLFQPELQESANKRKSFGRKSLFGNSATGESTPLFVLQPKGKRRSSGLGIDKEGLGSPKVAAMLDKRRSIGEGTADFVPQERRQQGVRFEDPVKLQQEVDLEREEEENREDGHIPPFNDRDATTNLRDMISSLTPKKNKTAGRKSLHVGAARGLLGKRPIELDEPDDESDNTPKRLRGREASPVKNIRLPAPPTKDETVGRLGRSPAPQSVGRSPAQASTTPTQQPKSSFTVLNRIEDEPSSSVDTSASEPAQGEPDGQEGSGPEFEPIQLQEFLDMTNIHFMELTTTKRRHTAAPDSATKRRARLSSDMESASKFDDCVAAGFCTVPMLELYQHVSFSFISSDVSLTFLVLPRVEVVYLRG